MQVEKIAKKQNGDILRSHAIYLHFLCMTEHIKEQGSQKQKSLTEQAKDAVQNIQKLAGNIDFKKAFPGMEKLMNTPDGEKTFSKISDLSQICT